MSNSKNNLDKNLSEEEKESKTKENIIKSQESKEVIYKEEVKYGETPYRWFFVVAYFLLVFQNQFQ